MLEINNLEVKVSEKVILNNFNLKINDGEIHALMGPNGAGKSSICKVILNHPDYEVTKGTYIFDNNDLSKLSTTEISRLGIFLISQNPSEIEGVTNSEMLRSVIGEITKEKVDIFKLNDELQSICKNIDLAKSFIHRDINFNMSGGEKKKNELMHLFILKPKFIILDEIDSGLDIDAIKTVGASLKKYYEEYKPSILIITHNSKIFKYLSPKFVHIINEGKIISSGDASLIDDIEIHGFKANVIGANSKNE